ncbi:MAG TPA: DNA repair protein RecO C-terminal domain-containing protein, partial [Myxococcaceae bacterium]|nr:DNA repair protein RecO C-terminal domain-containing protein [Myxococcaceae bacterium]
RVLFDPEHGGAVCDACSGRSQGGTGIPAELARALGDIQAGGRVPLPPESRRTARELLNGFIAHHLGKKLKSVDFMKQVGVD